MCLDRLPAFEFRELGRVQHSMRLANSVNGKRFRAPKVRDQALGDTSSVLRGSLEGDVRLVQRLNAGNSAALGDLFRLHQHDVARIIERMLGPFGDVQVVLQKAFLHAISRLPEYRGEMPLSTWIHREAVDVVLAYRRTQRRLRTETEVPRKMHSELDNRGVQPEHILERLLEQVAEKSRAVFILHEVLGFALTDIAKITRASILTVRSRLLLARRSLIALIGAEPGLDRLFSVATTVDDETERSKETEFGALAGVESQ